MSTNRKPRMDRRPRADTDKEPIHVAELDGDGRLKITSVIDAVNAALASGSATLDLQSRPRPDAVSKGEIATVIDAVKAIVGFHKLDITVSEAKPLPSTSGDVVWMASVVISVPGRKR